MSKVNKKDTRTISMTSYLTRFSTASIVDLEQTDVKSKH